MATQGSEHERDSVRVLRGGEVSRAISHLITKGEIACLAVALFAGIQLLRLGVRYDHLWLLGAAIASGAVLFGYPMVAVHKGRRGVLLMILPFGGFVPYLFGCYLVFFRGFWGLREGLSFYAFVRTAAFVLLGYQIVSSIYKATEFVKAVDEGRLRLE